MTIDPDSFTGAMLAVEGIEDAMVVLNGPTGCKLYHAHLSDCQYPRASSFDPLSYAEEFYFGQPRVPCTYLEGEDYIAGSTEKLGRILSSIASSRDGLIAVVNSPGASLIGDDLVRFIEDAGLSDRCIAIENTGYSSTLQEGFQRTVIKLLDWLELKRCNTIPDTVNIIGISLYHSNWDSSLEEIKRLLSLLGLRVGSVICAGTTLEELRRSAEATCNLVICEEYGLDIAHWYERNLSIPYVVSPAGAPVGFDATEICLKFLAAAMERDASQATEFIHLERRKQYRKIARFHSLTGLPKGTTFAVKADSSIALPLAKWLYYYLGMVPVGINTSSGGHLSSEQELVGFLKDIGFSEALGNFRSDEPADVVLADGHTVRMMREKRLCRAGVEIGLPSSGYVNFLPRTYMGINGSLFLLEEILNGIRTMP